MFFLGTDKTQIYGIFILCLFVSVISLFCHRGEVCGVTTPLCLFLLYKFKKEVWFLWNFCERDVTERRRCLCRPTLVSCDRRSHFVGHGRLWRVTGICITWFGVDKYLRKSSHLKGKLHPNLYTMVLLLSLLHWSEYQTLKTGDIDKTLVAEMRLLQAVGSVPKYIMLRVKALGSNCS